MDKIDKKILNQLQHNADITNAELAAKSDISASSCLRRVQRLKENGVIDRTVSLCEGAKLGRDLTAIVEVFFEKDGVADRALFESKIAEEGCVLQAYGVSGESDAMLTLTLSGMTEYRELCERLFSHDPNIQKFRTLFVMEKLKQETALPLDNIQGCSE